ncbi:hypothetical protein Poli38472_003941 [Pythium oligandrum]|uniref:UBA domain-containing protein n=1 Tax=Pythium oligandrum TaxID=41045 RepID=A0A8K1CP39_PYTOL|nr:hypothetical protein Poli38472_003941 [Pythium oligandrum]|eukprot:TMW66176.1 hypothetical protein Poli38472_003941 [Pythium oligandrum]
MAKANGERSFGMTLEQYKVASNEEYPCVSYVFPQSAASRAGMQPGWAVLSINGKSCRGLSVRDAAANFRDRSEVTMCVDTQRTVPTPPLAQARPVTSSAVPTATAVPAQSAGQSTLRAAAAPPSSTRAVAPPVSSIPVTSSSVPSQSAPPSAPVAPSAPAQTTTVSSQPAPVTQAPVPAASTNTSRVNATPVVTQTPSTMAQTPSASAAPSNTPRSVAKPSDDATQSSTNTTRGAGKKRGRQSTARSSPETSTASAKKPRARTSSVNLADAWDSDDPIVLVDSDTERSVEDEEVDPPSGRRRRYSTRQSAETGRPRRSLTVDRLIAMGFTQEDAEASVVAKGHNPEACMLWIVSRLEEKHFVNELNQASIESERAKRAEEEKLKKQESETLKNATAFTTLFPTSYILSEESEAGAFKQMLSSTIGSIDPDTLLRTLLTKLLQLEHQAIRWYKTAARCYMLQLALRLETSFSSHDALTCCSQQKAPTKEAIASCSCAFVRALHEEEVALNRALFDMPDNHGGVPVQFIRADESMQFSLEDDGFEVVEVPRMDED